MHILDALDRYVVQLRADGRSVHTIRQYERHVRLLATWLATRNNSGEVRDLDHELVALFLASPAATTRRDGRAKKANSTNALRSSLRTFLSYLHAAGYTQTNPGRLIRLARCGAPPPRALSEDEERRLLAVLDDAPERDRVLFVLMLRTGLRIGSALALDVGDVDADRRELVLRHTKNDVPTVVLLPSTLLEPLSAFIAGRPTGPLFVSRHGRLGSRSAHRLFARYARAADLRRASPHTLRHSFASTLYRRARDITLVQLALGHRSISSSVVYARCRTSDLREALG